MKNERDSFAKEIEILKAKPAEAEEGERVAEWIIQTSYESIDNFKPNMILNLRRLKLKLKRHKR